MKIALIENEAEVRANLRNKIRMFYPDVEIVGEADGVLAGRELILESNPELVFLDVEMGDGTGLDLLQSFAKPDFKVIFVTAHSKYAMSAFEYSALDYLLKPVEPERLVKALDKARKEIEAVDFHLQYKVLAEHFGKRETNTGRLILKNVDQVHVVKPEDILSCRADGSYTIFYLESGKEILVSKNLKEYEELLPSRLFFRSHKAHLVNLLKVTHFDKGDESVAVLTNGNRIPVSSRKREAFIAALENL